MDVPWTVDQTLAIVFALLTAFANALALSAQHIASTRQGERTSAWALVIFLMRQPLWLIGWLALTGSLIFQALALHFGPLSEVQPLLVSEIILALLLRRLWLGQRVRLLAWSSALVTVVGLALFLLASSPRGPLTLPAASQWTAPVTTVAVAILVLVILARRATANQRAGLYGAATGLAWALEATFIKATTDTFTSLGFEGTLTHWPLYAFVGGGVAGLLCEQAALHVGPLRISQPFIVIVDPLLSVSLGIWLYHERLHGGLWPVSLATVGFVVMCVGVVVLTQSAPATMKAELHRL